MPQRCTVSALESFDDWSRWTTRDPRGGTGGIPPKRAVGLCRAQRGPLLALDTSQPRWEDGEEGEREKPWEAIVNQESIPKPSAGMAVSWLAAKLTRIASDRGTSEIRLIRTTARGFPSIGAESANGYERPFNHYA